MPSRINITTVQGDDKQFEATLKEWINGVATIIDLVGCTVYFTVKEKYTDSTALISLDSTDVDKIEVLDESGGVVLIKINGDDTKALEPKTYVFDIRVKTVDGEYITCNVGGFTIYCKVGANA